MICAWQRPAIPKSRHTHCLGYGSAIRFGLRTMGFADSRTNEPKSRFSHCFKGQMYQNFSNISALFNTFVPIIDMSTNIITIHKQSHIQCDEPVSGKSWLEIPAIYSQHWTMQCPSESSWSVPLTFFSSSRRYMELHNMVKAPTAP